MNVNLPRRALFMSFITGVFVFIGCLVCTQTAFAQASVTTENSYTAFLQWPEANSQISGQTDFIIGVEQYINDLKFTLDFYRTSTASTADYVGSVYIMSQHRGSLESSYLWTARGDTMSFDNGLYFVKISAKDRATDAPVALKKGNGSEPVFGPFHTANSYNFVIPARNSVFTSGELVPSTVAASGLCSGVNFFLRSSDGNTVIAQSTGVIVPNTIDNSATFTENILRIPTTAPDGTYQLSFSMVTVGNTTKNNMAAMPVIVQMAQTPPSTCTPSWQCGSWSDCLDGVQTRSCTDLNNCSSLSGRPLIEQACTAANINTSIPSINTNSNANVSTNVNTSTATSAVPLTVTLTIPKEGDKVYGTVTLTAQVDSQAMGLEFYSSLKDSTIATSNNVLIGAGHPLANRPQIYEKSWDTAGTPDGEYYVYARAKNSANNIYLSNRVLVTINHQMEVAQTPAANAPADQRDDDNDKINNQDELALGTNPNNPDSNNNGIPDAEELVNDSNPSGSGSLGSLVFAGQVSQEKLNEIRQKVEQIAFDQPTQSGTLAPEKLKILSIENDSPKIGQNNLVIRGLGPANSYVTLFIYSTPVVVTTKTDASGNFTYILDKNLLDGQHEVYVTVTDDTGKIQEKSNPLTFFVRRAQAVSEADYLRGDINTTEAGQAMINNYLLIAVVIVVIVLIVLLGFYFFAKKQKNP